MLITVSGLVGSGKSTAVATIIRSFEAAGIPTTHWRFRTLPCFDWGPRRRPQPPTPPEPSASRRWSGYRQRSLSAKTALGLGLRTLAFRAYRWRSGAGVRVCSRYFYDNLVHYEMRTRRERLYAWGLRRLIPVPDMAILLVATVETLRERRPQYSMEYLTSGEAAYQRLMRMFPELIEVRTDAGPECLARLEVLVRRGLPDTSVAVSRESRT